MAPPDARTSELEKRVAELEAKLAVKTRLASKAVASYQQRALQMEIIRQQNEDLDRLATDLAQAKGIAEERAKDVEHAARLKSEFLANFSHEIRTPLNGVIGYCDLLSREEGERLTPHGRRDLNTIRSNARTLLALINDILDLSKIESGHVDIVRETVDVSRLADECFATVRDYLKGRDVELRPRIDDAAKIAFTDPLKLRQIVLNLLSNAAKFTEIGEVALDVTADGDDLVLVVEDTGVGIPSDELPHVFEKFRQVDGSSTREKGGSGLGLAIVSELCQLLGGKISVRSTVGRGSTFTVVLPGAVGNEVRSTTPTPATSSERADLDAVQVLVVDDDPMIQSLVRSQLEGDGCTVISAKDGVEALGLAREFSPHVIILDLQLPRLDGWSVLSQLKADSKLRTIPVVILSVEESRARGFSFGAFEYLVKPVEPERLTEVVTGAMESGQGTILVVDDEADARELVTRHLRSEGFTVQAVASGEEALRHFAVSPPALVVLDLVMPGLDGFDVLNKLREDGSKCNVVVLTGKDLSASERRTLELGFASVLKKGGSSLDQVVEEAKQFVANRRALSSRSLPKVLYVEDVAQNRDLVRRYLEGVADIVEATDGEHGLELARQEQPQLVLMDLSLPRLDGWEATRRIKSDQSLRTTPVVALTAHASAEDRSRARQAGCCDYLTKPVERGELIEAVRRHLRENQGRP